MISMSLEDIGKAGRAAAAKPHSRSPGRSRGSPRRLPADEDLEDFFENAAVGLHLIAGDGKILRANRAELKLLGYRADEYIGRNIADFHADRATIDDILKRLLRQEEINQYPALLRAKDGSIKEVLITSNARFLNGDFVNTRCLTLDVTPQARAERMLERRVTEQSALHELTFGLARANTMDDIYACALDAIIRALDCQRASILLFDHSDTLRFVAWRGLSDRYRRAVEGHSPWQHDSKNAEPISVGDIAKGDLPEDLRQVVVAEGIGALSFIPLQETKGLLGKFMVYYDQPHFFSEAEISLGLTIARQLAFSIERLRAAETSQRLVAIIESSDDAIISKDLNGVIKTWNPGAERLFGYKADDVIGKLVTILIPPDRINEEPHILSRIRNGETIEHYETVRQRKGGSLIPISLSVSPVRDPGGRIIGASNISRDISERKTYERKLLESEKQLQDLLASIPAAIYTTDAEGKITYFNQAAVDIAGRTPKIGSDEWCVTWKLYHPDGTPLPHDQCPMAVALREGRPIRDAEAIAERPDGSRVPFIPYPTPLRDSDGKIVGAINMLVDISERRQAETHQRVLLNELNHRVKNNMQMIQSLLSSATRRISDPRGREVLDEATRRISAMAAAQRALYGTLDATKFSCVEFLAAVCSAAQETLPENVRITMEGATGQLPNDCAMPLALILNELITNATKYGTKNDRASIRVGLIQDKENFTLSVEDDGPGFDFESLRETCSGLKLVQGLARQLRGQFFVTTGPTRCAVRFS
jgi:PAS domain S-box-containing protein